MKGLTKEKLLELKNNLEIQKECKKCNISKSFISFYAKKEKNNLYYVENKCNSCKYSERILANEKYSQKYIEKQRYTESFTIEGRARMLRNRCKQRAKIYNMEFSLSKEHVINLLSLKKCQKTNIPLIMDDSKYNPYAPSIDRIDNNKGHTNENTQIVCMIYNFCKNKFTEDDVYEFFKKVNNNE